MVVLLIASLMSVLCSCGEVNIYTPPENENTGDGICGQLYSDCFVSIISNQEYFDGDDIVLNFCFGIQCRSCISDPLGCGVHSSLVGKRVGLFLVSEGKKHLLKESTDFFCNEDYSMDFNTPGYTKIEDFHYSEEVSIPKDFFVNYDGDVLDYTGVLSFDISELDEESGEPISGAEYFESSPNRVQPTFYEYKTDGETVHFSKESFQYIYTRLWYDTENIYMVNKGDNTTSTYHIKRQRYANRRLMSGQIQNFQVMAGGDIIFLLKKNNKYEYVVYDFEKDGFYSMMKFNSFEKCLVLDYGTIYAVGKEIANFDTGTNIVDVAVVENSEANQRITKEYFLRKKVEFEGNTYAMENPDNWLGKIFDKLGIYTQIVINDHVIYDAFKVSILGEKQPYQPSDVSGGNGNSQINGAENFEVDGIFRFKPNGDGTCSVALSFGTRTADIVIPVTSPSGLLVTDIEDNAFEFNNNIISIVISDSVKSIGSYAFRGCQKLESISIPSGIISIGNNAFQRCGSLAEITIPNSVKTIGNQAFDFCANLQTIEIPESVISIGERAFNNCTRLKNVSISNSITVIEKGLFRKCSSLEEIVIPNSVTRISETAFSSCEMLSTITIPDSVTHIGSFVFEYCNNLESFNMPNGITNIEKGMFYSCERLAKIVIPDNVKSIGAQAFYSCHGLQDITIPENVVNIDPSAFSNCSSIEKIEVSENNPVYKSIDGNLYTKDGKTLIKVVKTNAIFVIGDCVTAIGDYAFSKLKNLESVIIPENVTSIGAYAFYGCCSLKNITVPRSVTSIGKGAFLSCFNMTSAIILADITNISRSMFSSCSNITSVVIGDSVTHIEDFAFLDASNLKTIYYIGTEFEWTNIVSSDKNEELTRVVVCYYSEEEPTHSGPYWHYDENGKIAIW